MSVTVGGTGVTFNDGTVQTTALTTTSVLNATAAASAGAVGTYAYLAIASSVTAGSTYAGSSLSWTGQHNGSSLSFGNNVVSGGLGGTQAGTWRAMGYSQSSNSQCLFLRIS